MDFSSPTQSAFEPLEEISYEPLDFQLADLMLELNGDKNKTLKNCVLEISKSTREGQIAIPCTDHQQTELKKTNIVGLADDYQPLILDNGYLYLRRYWQYQKSLSGQINSRLQATNNTADNHEVNNNEAGNVDNTVNDWLNEKLNEYFPQEGSETDWQKIAAKRAFQQKFLVLSGGPGTGKTTTITRLLALLIEDYIQQGIQQEKQLKSTKKNTPPLLGHFVQTGENQSIRIHLAAPTGKAAIRMLDAIRESQNGLSLSENILQQMPTKASTLHKLLGYVHGKVGFKHNKNNPLNTDLVIVDEASMIDIALMQKLLEAVPDHAKLILIGDKDQLSSVETGSVFTDICEGIKDSDSFVTLQKNWRFSNDSGIGQLAIATNNGDSDKAVDILIDEAKPECSLVSPQSLATNLLPHALIKHWESYFSVLHNPQSTIADIFNAFNHYRVLCALRRGLNGSTIISQRIESTLLKQGLIKSKGPNTSWYHGRPVMVTHNSYAKGLFNGDTGITLTRNGETKIYFPDEPDEKEGSYKSIAPVRLPAHETTWAMTIHKSQGSEFDNITLILPHEVMPLLTRQLIYTGITRAKHSVQIVSNQDVFSAGVKSEVSQATKIDSLLFTESATNPDTKIDN